MASCATVTPPTNLAICVRSDDVGRAIPIDVGLKSAGLFRPAMEPSMPFDFQQLANFRLARGSHKQPNKGGNICVNEAAMIAAGFQYREIRDVSCLPDCFSRPVSEYAIYLNDFMMHRVRNELLVPFITRLPGTSDAPWIEEERARSSSSKPFAVSSRPSMTKFGASR